MLMIHIDSPSFSLFNGPLGGTPSLDTPKWTAGEPADVSRKCMVGTNHSQLLVVNGIV